MEAGFVHSLPFFLPLFSFNMKLAQIPKSTFKKDWKLFFKKLHDRRSYLVESGLNQKSTPRMAYILDELRQYVDRNLNDVGTAKFILSKRYLIREIIVESNLLVVTRFELFVTQAYSLINPNS